MNTSKGSIARKDLIYCFIIFDLILLLAGLFTWKFRDSQDVINQVSLISSISSILLALVAIIYAFFQTISANKQSDTVHNTLIKIEEKVNELGRVKDELSTIKDEFILFREDSKTDKLEILKVINESQDFVRRSNESVIANLKEREVNIPADVESSVLEKSTEEFDSHLNLIKERIFNDELETENIIGNALFTFINNRYKTGDTVRFRDLSKFIRETFKIGSENTAKRITQKIVNDLIHPQSILEKKYITSSTNPSEYVYIKKDEFPGGPSGP